MSETELKPDDKVPTETLCTRLDELADAVTKGDASLRREYYMSIPAQPHRDADLVLYEAARRLRAVQSVLPDFDTRTNQPRPAVPVGEIRFELGAPSLIFADLYSEALPSLAPGTKLYAVPPQEEAAQGEPEDKRGEEQG